MTLFDSMDSLNYAVLDVGTTSTRCFVYNPSFEVIAMASRDIQILLPKYGFIEIEPENLMKDIQEVIREAVTKSNVRLESIVLGISTQRSVRSN